MAFSRAVAMAALVFLSLASLPALANDITLTARDGSVELTGTLITYDGEFYRIDTEYGELTVDGSGVICDGPACPQLGAYVAELTISGDRAVGAVLVPALIEGFARAQGYRALRSEQGGAEVSYDIHEGNPGRLAARIAVKLGSAASGFADLANGEADMAVALREPDEDERVRAAEAGLGDLAGLRQTRVLALDALLPVVAPGNPVRSLSPGELARVFAGEIVSWAELGGEDAPVSLHLTDPGSGFAAVFVEKIMAAAELPLSPAIMLHHDEAALLRAMETDPFAFGIVRQGLGGGASAVALGGVCGFELNATAAAIRAGDYPLTTPLYLFLPARKLPRIAREFLAYLRSDAARAVTRRAGFVDQSMGRIALAAQGPRLANAIRAAGEEVPLAELQRMVGFMAGRERLSLTFRFDDGESVLNAASRSNVALLVDLLDAGAFDGRALSFVGFSDGQGEASVNLKLAVRRAEAVRQAVLDLIEGMDGGAVTLTTEAFGEAMPMACDDSAWGRAVNRRVELWLE